MKVSTGSSTRCARADRCEGLIIWGNLGTGFASYTKRGPPLGANAHCMATLREVECAFVRVRRRPVVHEHEDYGGCTRAHVRWYTSEWSIVGKPTRVFAQELGLLFCQKKIYIGPRNLTLGPMQEPIGISSAIGAACVCFPHHGGRLAAACQASSGFHVRGAAGPCG